MSSERLGAEAHGQVHIAVRQQHAVARRTVEVGVRKAHLEARAQLPAAVGQRDLRFSTDRLRGSG